MKRLFVALCIMTVGISIVEGREVPTDSSQKNKPATVKILIGKEREDALIEVRGRYQIYDPANGLLIDTGVLSKRSTVRCTETGLQWANLLPLGVAQIRIVPGDSQCALLVDGIHYRGCIEVYASKDKIDLINEIDVENYLKATLSPLFPNETHQELLDALAITARTHAYYLLARSPFAFWHLEASKENYQGLALAHQNPHLDRAIDTTRYMVMTYKSSPFAALWTQDSAGKTATFSTIFRKEAKTPEGVSTPLALRDRDKHHWEFTITKEYLAKIAGVTRLSHVDLFIDQGSGKVYGLRVHDGLQTKDLDFFTLQQALGFQKLRSSDFTIALKRENIVFSGYGEGHGVGLCLHSARLLADQGEKAQKILSLFFPQTQLEHRRSLN